LRLEHYLVPLFWPFWDDFFFYDRVLALVTDMPASANERLFAVASAGFFFCRLLLIEQARPRSPFPRVPFPRKKYL